MPPARATALANRRSARETPIRRQYDELKAQHPGCLLLFQLGDFFECFEEDARTLAEVCAVTLTSREFGRRDRVPLAGIPITRLEHYLARLIEAGHHVAVAEQVADGAGEANKGLVDRIVTRVVTPGTLAEPGLLREKENNYLAALVRATARGSGAPRFGLAYVDVTTGEFALTQIDGEDAETRLRVELDRLAPAELLVPEGQAPDPLLRSGQASQAGHLTVCQPWRFHEEAAGERLRAQLGVLSLEGFGCAGMPLAVGAAGAILSYLEENNRRLLPNLTGLRAYSTAGGMALDAHTRRNLELLRNGRTGRIEGSLLGVLDRTRTPMGGRLLRRWISQPLLDRAEIERRLDGVAALAKADRLRPQVRALLGRIGDLERQLGRVSAGTATPRELLDLASSLGAAAGVAELAVRGGGLEAEAIGVALRQGEGRAAASLLPLGEGQDEGGAASFPAGTPSPLPSPSGRGDDHIDPCLDVADLIARAVAPPGSGRRIKAGHSSELDELVGSVAGARRRVAEMEDAERRRTGIKSLKVGYNKVFGYYLEVTRPNLKHVPADYQRKQTLSLAERFVTPELRQHETAIAASEDRIAALEAEAYAGLLGRIVAQGPRLRRLAAALARLDVLAGLADLARECGYCRPVVDESDAIDLVDARHPVVEAMGDPGGFIPNDCRLDGERRVIVLTGPNMAGKSTYLRQVALCVLLAQMGSFVPARAARIGLVDRIFTRVGAQDDIAAGASTFMVEMMEAAAILRHATRRSLVVLDEIGRGTSTFDGLSIARAIVEDVHGRIGARTLFATHFHELAALADELPGIRVCAVAVAEENGEVVFLRRVVPGAAGRSYGVQVARLAGLPPWVTERAEEILRRLEGGHDLTVPGTHANGQGHDPHGPHQPTLDGFAPPAGAALRVVEELLALDPARLTPIEALTRLFELRQRVGMPP